MTHQDSNPDESEDRGKELLRKQAHAVSGTNARETFLWLVRYDK